MLNLRQRLHIANNSLHQTRRTTPHLAAWPNVYPKDSTPEEEPFSKMFASELRDYCCKTATTFATRQTCTCSNLTPTRRRPLRPCFQPEEHRHKQQATRKTPYFQRTTPLPRCINQALQKIQNQRADRPSTAAILPSVRLESLTISLHRSLLLCHQRARYPAIFSQCPRNGLPRQQ